MMTENQKPAEAFAWLLNNFVDSTTGVSHALAVSADGIKLASSEHLPKANADQFAAITAGLSSLIHGCLLYTSPSPRDATLSRMPSSA